MGDDSTPTRPPEMREESRVASESGSTETMTTTPSVTSNENMRESGRSKSVTAAEQEFAEEFVEDATKTVTVLFGLLGTREVRDLTNASKRVKFKNFLTGADDVTIFNVSFMSRPAEWHAAAVGMFVALGFATAMVSGVGVEATGQASGGLLGAAFLMGRVLHKMGYDTPHVQDALEEPAYAVGGWVLGWVIRFGIMTLGLGGLPAL